MSGAEPNGTWVWNWGEDVSPSRSIGSRYGGSSSVPVAGRVRFAFHWYSKMPLTEIVERLAGAVVVSEQRPT